jgi:hypothetical protein
MLIDIIKFTKVAESLLTRLEDLLNVIRTVENANRNVSGDSCDDRFYMARVTLFWHVFELQLTRLDLRYLHSTTSSRWMEAMKGFKLSWQSCWEGNNSALEQIEKVLGLLEGHGTGKKRIGGKGGGVSDSESESEASLSSSVSDSEFYSD